MKIVYMGTPDFAVGALEALIAAGNEIAEVVTQPDKPKGRSRELAVSPVKKCALAHGIPVFQPVRIKAPEAVAHLKTLDGPQRRFADRRERILHQHPVHTQVDVLDRAHKQVVLRR